MNKKGQFGMGRRTLSSARRMRLHDAFRSRADAEAFARDLRAQGVQNVRVRKISGQLPYGVFIGGRGAEFF